MAPQPGEQIFRGIAASAGVVQGRVLVLDGGQVEAPERRLIPEKKVSSEIDRLEAALVRTREQIRDLQSKVRQRLGADDAEIFEAHALVLEDQVLIDQVIRCIREKRVAAEFAFHDVASGYTRALADLHDEYLRERAADLRDLTGRVLRNLSGKDATHDLRHLPEPRIVLAHDLTPSATAQLDRENVLGFATDVGGKTSHTAILAGSMGIPAVVGLKHTVHELSSGDFVLLDGFNGLVIRNPSDQTLFEYGQLERRQVDLHARMAENRDTPAITLDGHRVVLSANVEQISDTAAVIDCGAEGVGLFRTEFLFMERDTLPTEEEQYLAYHRVASALKPNGVIFRTLDIGGDQLSGTWQGAPESNPFLGWRAIRLCLQETGIFCTQLRALLRASAHGNVRVMYPMISSVDEFDEANRLLEQCKGELRAKSTPFDEALEVGAMIEIPSAVLVADALAKRARFFSLGTNDLIQYTLAVDRLNERIAHLYNPTHPALLRLIQMTVEAGKRHGIWTGVCGEMAGDPALVPLLLGLGVDELSVAPPMVPMIKHLVRRLKLSEAREMAQSALQSESSVDILARSRALVQRTAPGLFEIRPIPL